MVTKSSRYPLMIDP